MGSAGGSEAGVETVVGGAGVEAVSYERSKLFTRKHALGHTG